jgi:histidinol dehydrogenase
VLSIRRLDAAAPDFWTDLERLLAWEEEAADQVQQTVRAILGRVRREGDRALVEYTQQFDRLRVERAADLEVPRQRLEQALAALPENRRQALSQAAQRIRAYHQHQRQDSWSYRDDLGNLLGQQVVALDRVGVYVPGGKAAYPSSVLMNVIPAKVAGVPEVIMVVPTPAGEVNELVLAAAAMAGVDQVFTVGGAQAVAALAYGTDTVPRVDKVVGPGNIYVATAKRLVYGTVGIDMIAGPSEILVVCDGKTEPDWIAMDLFSQAEHDEDAQAILVCPLPAFLDRVAEAMARLLPGMSRAPIIEQALLSRGALVQVRDLDQAVEVVNFVAPEHLELSVADPQALAARVRHAGAIFLGRYTAEAMGDYCAGPNHVLPTARSARFSSPLGVYDFQKRSSLIECSPEGAAPLGQIASVLAEGEGLTAHARSAEYRIRSSGRQGGSGAR